MTDRNTPDSSKTTINMGQERKSTLMEHSMKASSLKDSDTVRERSSIRMIARTQAISSRARSRDKVSFNQEAVADFNFLVLS